MDFASLPDDVRAEVREKQRLKKMFKKQCKSEGKSGNRPDESTDHSNEYPSRITKNEYFGAAGGLFRDPNLLATEENLELLLRVLGRDDEQARRLQSCNYFQFSGPEDMLWDSTFNARLAYEGFFTITSSRRGPREPLPELQPFYGVLTWPNFEASKHVRKALGKLTNDDRSYRLTNCKNPARTWRLLNAYHVDKYGSNWLTEQYFQMLWLASEDPSINFRMNCIELYFQDVSGEACSDDDLVPLAGEIGFSIGRVYTSLSGWTEKRTADGFGFAQLVLLGRWLQRQGYEFWSLGHCYSPEMDYKRELGHRVYPRSNFLALLKQHRGSFRQDDTAVSDKQPRGCFEPLEGEGTCDAKLLLEAL